MRHEEIKVCKECKSIGLNCSNGKRCIPIREKPKCYSGVRFTADGFDCALPVTIDSHNICAYGCLYCFSDNILGHSVAGNKNNLGETPLLKIENIFNGNAGKSAELFRKALRYNKRNRNGFPAPVQLGGLCDAGDSIEQNHGWLLKFIDLAIKYNQPVRMSTKSAIFLIDEYFEKIKKAPHLFWVAFSIITNEDEIIEKVDRSAPNATMRFKAMKRLSEIGVSTSLRLRPIMRGITDRNQNYKDLIIRAKENGAKAISYEVGFYPSAIPNNNKWKWELLNQISRVDYKRIYKSFGKLQSCTRPSYLWTENIMHSIKEIATQNELTVGVSDPVWKQLTDVGCCCGIKPDDPVFGNWEIENATNTLLKASKSENKKMYLKDIIPEWAWMVKASDMFSVGMGERGIRKSHLTWADYLSTIWNNPNLQRSPVNYFQGAVVPTNELDKEGNIIYEYKGLQRQYMESGWNIAKHIKENIPEQINA